MTTTAIDDPAVRGHADLPSRHAAAEGWNVRGRTVLVASNGSPASTAAVRVACDLARMRGARPTLVRAYHAASTPSPAAALATHANQQASAHEELRYVVPEARSWHVRLAVGAPQDVIVMRARAVDAALILMGRRKGDPLQRAFGNELLLQVLRHSRCPVLATTTWMHSLPARVVVGLDIDAPSTRVAQAAASLAAHGASVELVFLGIPRQRATDPLLDDETRARHAADASCRTREQLTIREDLQVRTTVLTGVTADALRAVALDTDADLVALGTARHRFTERLLFGNMTARELREERWSVLAVPAE